MLRCGFENSKRREHLQNKSKLVDLTFFILDVNVIYYDCPIVWAEGDIRLQTLEIILDQAGVSASIVSLIQLIVTLLDAEGH